MPTGKNKTLGLMALAGVKPYVEKANEEYMGTPQKEHFKKILDAWRVQLREEVDRTVTHMQDEAANFPDLNYVLEIVNVNLSRKLKKPCS